MQISLSQWANTLVGHVPLEAFAGLNDDNPIEANDILGFVRTWLIDGIPFCFVERPMAYDRIREYLGEFLEIDPRNTSLVGSARLGFSLSPRKFLRPFTTGVSDLDALCVSERIFEQLIIEYDTGYALWSNGHVVVGRHKGESLEKNAETVERTRQRGFIDINKVPVFRPNYIPQQTLRCEVAMKRVMAALSELEYLPRFGGKPSLRIFRSWNDAVDQSRRSLSGVLRQIMRT